MAEIWLAIHPRLGVRRALKIPRSGVSRGQDRLVLEARLQSLVHHRGVLGVLDVVRTELGCALVLPLVRGPSLEQLLAWRGFLTGSEAAAVLLGIVDGVRAIHAAGIVHRDLKPGNVLLEISGDVLVPRVSDFGLARRVDTPYADRGPVGTPAYAAPEQVSDAGSAGCAADLWSLGALAYEMVTGLLPFAPPVDGVWVEDLDRYRPPSLYGADPSWDPILGGLLEREPADRLPLRALSAWLGALRGRLPPTAPILAAWHPPADVEGTWAGPSGRSASRGPNTASTLAMQGGP